MTHSNSISSNITTGNIVPRNLTKNFFMTEQSLTNKVILITGASRGIGCAIAKDYARAGATVILLARNTSDLIQVYDEIENENNPKPAIYPFNLATNNFEDYVNLFQNIEKHFQKLDGIVLNAAELGILTPIEHYAIEEWHQILQVNLNSNFLLIKTLLPLLKKASSASIIFTAENFQPTAKAFWGAYAVSKRGLDALMEILAEELENTSIRINKINPKKAKTQLRRKAFPAEDSELLPLPEELTTPYIYLMSDNGKAVKGQHFDINYPL